MIYFIRRPDGGPIKIGTTVKLSQRLKQLVAEHGSELQVLAVAEGSFDQERELHCRFGHLRVMGEWFEPGDDLIALIVAEGRPWDETTEKTRPVRLDLPPKAHRLLRLVAADEDISMAAFARDKLVELLEIEAKKRGIKG